MKRLFIFSGLLLIGASAFGQSFTFTGSGTGLSATGINISSSALTGTTTRTGTWTLVGTTSLANPFNRFTVREAVSRTISSGLPSETPPSATTTTPLAGTQTTTGVGASGSATNYTTAQNGNTFAMSASITPVGLTTTATATLSATQAPLATGSLTTSSVAAPVTALVTPISTSTLWVFDFPGINPTGTATLSLSNVAGSFQRALDGLGQNSRHRDNVRIEVTAFLNGVPVGATKVSAINTTLGVSAGTATNAISFTSIPNVTINVGDIYNQTKALTVVTKLIGTAYLGNSTSLGDYTIASNTWSGVSVQGVPEPASLAALSLGLIGFAKARRRRNS